MRQPDEYSTGDPATWMMRVHHRPARRPRPEADPPEPAAADACTAEELAEGGLDTSTCGCDDCRHARHDQIDSEEEAGVIDAEEAHDRRARLEQFGI